MKAIKIISIVGIVAVAGAIGALAILNPDNVAETSENNADLILATRHYKIGKSRILREISGDRPPLIVKDIEFLLAKQKTYLRSWKVGETKSEKDSAVIKAEVPVVFFTDDLELRLQYLPAKDENSEIVELVVNVRSASRVGNSDFGENRRHVNQILEELDFFFQDDRL